MLLRSLGAMNGLRGICWAAYGWAVAALPVNGCTTPSRGSEGIGTAGVETAPAAAVSTPLSARRAASANAVRRKAVSMASPTTHPAWGNAK